MKKLLLTIALSLSGTSGFAHGAGKAVSAGLQDGKTRSISDTSSRRCDPCPQFTYGELWALQTKFWERFKYPANVEEAKSINSTLFSENVQGRVDITRNFPGRELNTEYLFGLFADPSSVTLINVPVSYEITEFAANDYIAAATTVVMFNSTLLEIQLPVTIDTFIAWNDRGEIVQYDATFRWFGYLLHTLVTYAAGRFGVSTPEEAVAALTSVLAESICGIHERYCTGENQQYDNITACHTFLTETVRFGQDFELGQNTLLCRTVHQEMVRARPEVHCPHISLSGGDMCVDDQTYEDKVLEDYFTNVPFVVQRSDDTIV